MKPNLLKIFTENADFQYIETLKRNRTKRARAGEFFVEGVRNINYALEYGWQVNAFVYTREKRLSDWASGILEQSNAKKHYELPAALLEKLSDKEDTSELLALVTIPANDLARIPVRNDLCVLVLDRPASPGNLGTIIRSCDALGVHGLVVTGHAADLYDPETIRATTGSFFALPGILLPSHKELLPWLDSLRQRLPGLQLVGTSAKAQKPICEHDFTAPTVLVVGNENHGISESYRALCDALLTIPMSGSASSLNIASATSILLYEISRQRS